MADSSPDTGPCTQCTKLQAEIAVLRDLLETQYRETDKARAEADKAGDEALEFKLELARLKLLGTQNEVQLVWELKGRLDKAVAAGGRK
jgi:hypothetical protein